VARHVQPLASTGRAANLTFRLGVAIAIAAYLITPKMNRATAAPGDRNRAGSRRRLPPTQATGSGLDEMCFRMQALSCRRCRLWNPIDAAADPIAPSPLGSTCA
jgi:hypothetical protein